MKNCFKDMRMNHCNELITKLFWFSNLYLQTSADQRTDYYMATYIMLGVGAMVSIMGFLGCCGAWRQSAWMLGTFFAFLLIVFFLEIGLGIVVYFHVSQTNCLHLIQHSLS